MLTYSHDHCNCSSTLLGKCLNYSVQENKEPTFGAKNAIQTSYTSIPQVFHLASKIFAFVVHFPN